MILRRFKTGTRGSSRSWPVKGQGGVVEKELYTKTTTCVKTQRHLIDLQMLLWCLSAQYMCFETKKDAEFCLELESLETNGRDDKLPLFGPKVS